MQLNKALVMNNVDVVLSTCRYIIDMIFSGTNSDAFKQAGESKIKTKKAQIEEEIRLAYNAMQISNYEKEWQIDEKAEGLEKELRRIDSSAAVGVNGTDLKIVYKG